MSRVRGRGWSGVVTCHFLPAQVEGRTDDGRALYYRNRAGDERLGLGATVEEAREEDATVAEGEEDELDADALRGAAAARGEPPGGPVLSTENVEAWIVSRVDALLAVAGKRASPAGGTRKGSFFYVARVSGRVVYGEASPGAPPGVYRGAGGDTVWVAPAAPGTIPEVVSAYHALPTTR